MKCEVLIVGGGIAGLSTAYFLARAGVDVLLVEAASALGTHATGQNAAILRSLLADSKLTAIGRNSAAHLHAPPKGFAGGQPLVDANGLLLTADANAAEDLATWQIDAGPAPHLKCQGELVDAPTATRLAPHLQHPDWPTWDAGSHAAIWFPNEGQINIAALVEGFAKGATAPGPGGQPARILLSTQVKKLTQGASAHITGATLADGRQVHADAVLFTGGAWAGSLARAAGSPLDFAPRRRHLVVVTGTDAGPFHAPIIWNHSTSGRAFYTRPEAPGLLICACDESQIEPSAGPDSEACPRDPAFLENIAQIAAEFLPTFADSGVSSWWAGWRTFATAQPKERFTIGPDPSLPGLFWCAGLGGHGMTASFEVGRLAACSIAQTLAIKTRDSLAGSSYDAAFLPRTPSSANR